ncbi:MAG: hypothetical protein HKN39_06770 [Flavobacteriales bacterium]|nr:hypothetical protein [Flavobacteriales bacterium]
MENTLVMKEDRINGENTLWNKLSNEAWDVRQRAFLQSGGSTHVGASLVTDRGNIYSGCNIQHMYRSHDIHAEVNAISNMVSGGDNKIERILIVAVRAFFTPCGSCMDWIMQFSDDDTIVGFQNEPGGDVQEFTTKELMPHYPK